MNYFHFSQLFGSTHIGKIRDQIDPYFSRPIKTTAADTEIDLTTDQVIPATRKIVEDIVSECYKKSLTCNNYWISISQPGESVVEHHHQNQGSTACLSAVLYVQAEGPCGNLYLKDFDKKFTPKTGDLVLFPSNCVHSVDNNRGECARICVAFDFVETV